MLIVSAHSDVDQLDSPLVRRLFLGLTVTQHGSSLRPYLNESDSQLKEIFLQNIVSMSESTYDRYVLQLSLKQGRTQPVVYRSNAQLISSVALDPTAVSYAWLRDGRARHPGTDFTRRMAQLRSRFANLVTGVVVAVHLVLLPALYFGVGYVDPQEPRRLVRAARPKNLRASPRRRIRGGRRARLRRAHRGPAGSCDHPR